MSPQEITARRFKIYDRRAAGSIALYAANGQATQIAFAKLYKSAAFSMSATENFISAWSVR